MQDLTPKCVTFMLRVDQRSVKLYFVKKYRPLILIIIFVIGISYILTRPIVEEYTPRNAVSEIIASFGASRVAIDNYYKNNKSLLGAGSVVLGNINPNSYSQLNEYYISDNGVLIGINEEFSVIVILEPKVISNKLEWLCIAYPRKWAPHLCKGETKE